ncbi:phage tail assembly protein [Pseudomonas cremoricolorata]|uniref:phage tail assembly protein n=1 Tax=Pseudomonas cremoricolorata TaxID=157783 RepID=UPI000675C179|nr:phage tail assembly protein [Pseudomonas cremoricolorata]
MAVKFLLNAPINAHGAEIDELTLRRPTSREAQKIRALPYKLDKDEAVCLDLDAVAKYVVVCTGIPPSAVDQLDLNDLNQLGWQITGFFMTPASKALTNLSQPPTTSPGSGEPTLN